MQFYLKLHAFVGVSKPVNKHDSEAPIKRPWAINFDVGAIVMLCDDPGACCKMTV